MTAVTSGCGLHPRGDDERRASIIGEGKARRISAQQIIASSFPSAQFATHISRTTIMKTALYLSAAMAVAMTGVDAGVHRQVYNPFEMLISQLIIGSFAQYEA